MEDGQKTAAMSDAEGAAEGSSSLPDDAHFALRNRRERRLTAKYAEALEEQQTRKQRRPSGRRGSSTPQISSPPDSMTMLRSPTFVSDEDPRSVEDFSPPPPPPPSQQRGGPPTNVDKTTTKKARASTPVKIIEGKRRPKANVSTCSPYLVSYFSAIPIRLSAVSPCKSYSRVY